MCLMVKSCFLCLRQVSHVSDHQSTTPDLLPAEAAAMQVSGLLV